MEKLYTVNKRVWNAVLGCNLKNDRMISVHFQGKPFNIKIIQIYALTSNAEEAETDWFYENLQDLLESTSSGPTVHTHNHSTGCDDIAAFTGLTAQQAQHLRLDTQRPRDKLVLTACHLPHRLDHPICCGLYVPVLKSLCHFWDCTQAHHFRLFCWLWWLLYCF